MDALIRQAIAEKRLLEFTYNNHQRIVEPHVYGIKNDKYQLLTYQVGGWSSKPEELPDWRRFDLDKMVGIQMLDEGFFGPRDSSPFIQSDFDVVVAAVR